MRSNKPTDTDRELCRAAMVLMEDGTADLTAEEIAEGYYGSDKAIFREMIDGISKRLPRIVYLLESEHETCAVLVNQRFFRGKKPQTKDDARRCLANGRRAHGIHVVKELGDPILEEHLWLNNKKSGGSLERSANQILLAFKNRVISLDSVQGLARSHLCRAESPELKTRLQELFFQANLLAAPEGVVM